MKHGPSTVFRFTVYPLTLIVFFLISGFMVLLASGYDIKYKDGRFYTEKTGMIIVASRPGDSTVTLDGETQPKKTPSLSFFNLKMKRVSAGVHRLVVSHDGYETWEGDVVVNPGLVSWRNYLLLVPLERKPIAYDFAGTVESSVVARDQKRSVLLTMDRVQNIYNFWLINNENKESFKIAEATAAPGDVYELTEISKDYSKYMYKKTAADKSVTYFVAEAKNGGLVYNINSLYSNTAEKYYFSPYNNQELYFLQAGSVYKINLSEKTESAALVREVVSVNPTEDELLIFRKTDEDYGLWVMGGNNDVRNIIKTIPASTSYDVAYLKSQKSYLVREGDEKDLLLYSNDTKNPTLEIIARNVHGFAPSPDGERVAIYKDDAVQVYDLLKKEYYDTLSATKVVSLDWAQDSKNLIYRTDNEIKIVNYNGDYNKSIFTVSAGSLAIMPNNNYNLFYLNTVENDTDLYTFSL